jgi:hypothetical protein
MADPAHVELVKQGAEALRKWQEDNPGMRLNLGGADLREANLGGANLEEVQGAEDVFDLETVRFISAEDTEGSASENDARYFETCHRPWPERWLDWAALVKITFTPVRS